MAYADYTFRQLLDFEELVNDYEKYFDMIPELREQKQQYWKTKDGLKKSFVMEDGEVTFDPKGKDLAEQKAGIDLEEINVSKPVMGDKEGNIYAATVETQPVAEEMAPEKEPEKEAKIEDLKKNILIENGKNILASEKEEKTVGIDPRDIDVSKTVMGDKDGNIYAATEKMQPVPE